MYSTMKGKLVKTDYYYGKVVTEKHSGCIRTVHDRYHTAVGPRSHFNRGPTLKIKGGNLVTGVE